MKNHLMSLAVCLACFWSSYGSANYAALQGYLNGQILKYCKAYIVKIFRGDSQGLNYEAIRMYYKAHPTNKWFCRIRNTDETRKYIIKLVGFSGDALNKNEIDDAYNRAISNHSEGHIISVAGVEYNYSPVFGDPYKKVGYFAITKFCTEDTNTGIFRSC